MAHALETPIEPQNLAEACRLAPFPLLHLRSKPEVVDPLEFKGFRLVPLVLGSLSGTVGDYMGSYKGYIRTIQEPSTISCWGLKAANPPSANLYASSPTILRGAGGGSMPVISPRGHIRILSKYPDQDGGIPIGAVDPFPCAAPYLVNFPLILPLLE